MKKKIIALLGMTVMSCALVTGCGGSKTPAAESEAATEAPAEEQEGTDALTEEQTSDEADAQEETEEKTAAAVLEDGTYTAEFDTDSSMFHVNEACEGKGTLTVKDGIMTIHVSMPSKNIVNLYPGLAEDAQKEGAELLQPTTDTVTYSDGMTEEANGFDVPVPALDEEFDLALIGTKGTWYDHKVSVSNPEKIEEMSSRELGHATFTSAASVTRFCQKIGVKGFPEFKMQFVRELRTGGMEDVSAVTMSERENVVTMVRKAEKIQRQAVEETNKELSYTQLVRIGKLIADASCVDFYVYDMNIYLAKYGCALFFHAGKLSSVHSEINIQGLHAAMPADGHVAIIISHTGKNEQLAEIEKMLHRGGTKIIVISGNRKGVVGQYATEFLYAAGSEKVEEFWSSTFFASGKYLLDILYGMEFSRRYEENIALNSRYEKSGKNLLWRFSEKESD